MKKKLQFTQNKCIRFCLKLNCRQNIGPKWFKEIIWLPIKETVEKPVAAKPDKCQKGTSPFHAN